MSRASENRPQLRKERQIRRRIWESLFRSWYEQETSRLGTKAGRGNNSSGHETLQRRLVELLIVRDIQLALHTTTSKLYRTM
jgi:hypothetical protein